MPVLSIRTIAPKHTPASWQVHGKVFSSEEAALKHSKMYAHAARLIGITMWRNWSANERNAAVTLLKKVVNADKRDLVGLSYLRDSCQL